MGIIVKDTDGVVFCVSVSNEELKQCHNRHDTEALALKYARQLEEQFAAYKRKAIFASVYGKVTKNETT